MSKLHEVLDRILDIEVGTEREAIQEFEESDGEPLAEDLVERIVRRCVASPTLAAVRPRWWRRPAAVVPLAVVLAAATVPIVMKWSGRRSTETLPYEQAIETVFDRSRGIETRLAALGRIHTSLQVAFLAIEEKADHETSSGRQALQALGSFASAIEQSVAEAGPLALSHYGTFARLTDRLASSELTQAECVEVITSLERDALVGIWAMKQAAEEGPRLATYVEIFLRRQREAVVR